MNSIIINVCVRNKHKYLLSVHIGRVCGCFLSSPHIFRLLELELFNSYLLLCNIARCCMVWQNFFIDAKDWIWNMFDDDVSSGWLEDVDLSVRMWYVCLVFRTSDRTNLTKSYHIVRDGWWCGWIDFYRDASISGCHIFPSRNQWNAHAL